MPISTSLRQRSTAICANVEATSNRLQRRVRLGWPCIVSSSRWYSNINTSIDHICLVILTVYFVMKAHQESIYLFKYSFKYLYVLFE